MSRTLLNFSTLILLSCVPVGADEGQETLDALERSGANAPELKEVLEQTEGLEHKSAQFLITNMPDSDLTSLSSEYLLSNIRLAIRAWNESPWKEQVPESVFLNNILPYASVNERRDDWRAQFHSRFSATVAEVETISEAAALLNKEVFEQLKVKYSTKRRRADQGPFESIQSGRASCTGLSILLIDACRAVGVPARFVGTPLWSDNSGNHSWVEIWDDGWHFTGAAEPRGIDLDKAWFVNRASGALRDDRLKAIYAVSFKKSPLRFPMVWARNNRQISATNVTDRYTRLKQEVPEGHISVMFQLSDTRTRTRVSAPFSIRNSKQEIVYEGTTNDGRFDSNDHVAAVLRKDEAHSITIKAETGTISEEFAATEPGQLFTYSVPPDTPTPSVPQLRKFLQDQPLEKLSEQPFAQRPITAEESKQAQELISASHAAMIRKERDAEMKAKVITISNYSLPFWYKVYGKRPKTGRSLFISMHGGGGAPKRVNDSQWENQKRLYQPKEGIYLAPRAPTDSWNMWHQGHITQLFDRLIENLIVFESVDPNRIYLMGYSAGGDGVYQLAPRMADRFAAAAMMAGHPNETSALGLRNLPFALYMGGKDSAYKRNATALQWKEKLAALRESDPDGYEHLVTIYPDKGHWMDREDASSLSWMAQHDRKLLPSKIVWKQDDVTGYRFYWLAIPSQSKPGRAEVRAQIAGQQVDIESDTDLTLAVRLNDKLLDLDQPISVTINGSKPKQFQATRTIAMLAKTMLERGDSEGMFDVELTLVCEEP